MSIAINFYKNVSYDLNSVFKKNHCYSMRTLLFMKCILYISLDYNIYFMLRLFYLYLNTISKMPFFQDYLEIFSLK